MKLTLTLLVIIITGLSLKGQQDLKVRVYPNPATDFIRVEWSVATDTEVHVEIYDLVGTRISQNKSDNSVNHIRINLESFQRSAYLLKVFSGDGSYSRTYRIVKY